MYVCMYICMYVCVCVSVCMYVSMYVCMYVCMLHVIFVKNHQVLLHTTLINSFFKGKWSANSYVGREFLLIAFLELRISPYCMTVLISADGHI